MATKPRTVEGAEISEKTVNAMINASPQMRAAGVPYADGSAENLREIGKIIMQYEPLQNEFLGIMNRIANVIVTSKLYTNNLAPLKRGMFDFGETIEDIFLNIARPHNYDIDTASKEVFKIEKPDARVAFYTINYKKFYKQTVNEIEMQSAFLSYQGMADFIAKIVDSMYSAAAYDEQQVMLYTLAKWILNGHMHAEQINTVSAANMKGIVSKVKAISNKMQFMKPIYNAAGVPNFSRPQDQYILISSEFDASMDVEVLASAFNMNMTTFLQQRYLVDTFGALDIARLNEIFAGDNIAGYEEIGSADLVKLDTIPLIVIDKNFFQIYDNRLKFRENYNGQGDYWNYFYHTWKTFAISPFANASLFVPGKPTITSVSVSPTTLSLDVGASATVSANVVTDNFANKAVNWLVTVGDDKVTVDANGLVTGLATGSATVQATSVEDPTKKATCAVTVS